MEPDGYDAAKNSAGCYDVAIAEKRRRKEWTDRLTAAKRVEFIGDCIMIEGDCLEVMPQIGKVDAVVTDPPYGIETLVGAGGMGEQESRLQMIVTCQSWKLHSKF